MNTEKKQLVQESFKTLQQQVLNELSSKAEYQHTTIMQLLEKDEKLFEIAHKYTLILSFLIGDANMRPNAYVDTFSASDLSQAALKILEINETCKSVD